MGLTILNNETTHRTNDTETILDIIATNNIDAFENITTTPPSLSRHNGVVGTLRYSKKKKTKIEREIFEYDRANWIQFNKDIINHEWEEITENSDLDQIVNKWTDKMKLLIRKNVPTRKITLDESNKRWMTNKIKQTKRKKEQAYKQAKKKNKPKQHYVWNRLKKLQQELKDEIIAAKEARLEVVASRLNNPERRNDKEGWKLATDLYKRKSTDNENSPLLVDGKILTDDKDKAEALNEFFVSMGKLENEDEEITEERKNSKCSLEKIELTREEIEKIMKNLNQWKASGPDQISYRVLKFTASSASEYLTRIFNLSLLKQKMPTEWKKANVTPLFKKDKKTECSNYRPVSLLVCVSKIMERGIHNHMMEYLVKNDLISSNQSTFQKGVSTITQLLEMYDDIGHGLDRRMTTKSIYCDVSKAFDRVWHRGLLFKLENIGIKGDLLMWIKDYLTDRMQRVVLKGGMSGWKKILAGVPQGSILGPLLFIVYIDDIVPKLESKTRLFADDLSLSATERNAARCAEALQPQLDVLINWTKTWKIKLNPTKTECVTTTRSKNPKCTIED